MIAAVFNRRREHNRVHIVVPVIFCPRLSLAESVIPLPFNASQCAQFAIANIAWRLLCQSFERAATTSLSLAPVPLSFHSTFVCLLAANFSTLGRLDWKSTRAKQETAYRQTGALFGRP
mgnify:CR=1 FL=1